jgi:TPP-dependent indolepyruvate ferredoxin oxidoreductase alpha subunit
MIAMMTKLVILFSCISLFGCSSIYFSPISWFDFRTDEVKTSATIYGDCTTDLQCEELVPGQHFFCYKEQSYVGQCVQVLQ